MIFSNEHPGNWQQYIKRKDIIGLPIMEVKRKYMIEESQFMNFMASTATANSSVGTGIGTGAPSRHADWGKNGDKYLRKGAYKEASPSPLTYADNVYMKFENEVKGTTQVSQMTFQLVGGDDPANAGINGKPYYQSTGITAFGGSFTANTNYYIRWVVDIVLDDHWELYQTVNLPPGKAATEMITGNVLPYPSTWTLTGSHGLTDGDGIVQVRDTTWMA